MESHMTMFTNPWADDARFIDLGEYKFTDVEGVPHYYELYALTGTSKRSISFGARYGDEPQAYISGEANKIKDTWSIDAGGSPLLMAVARFFANHYG